MLPISDEFCTISAPTEGFFKDKGSRFLAFAFPVNSENEIDEFRSDLRKKYFDARHHVYAFRLGADAKNFRASDDGEPANSSGQPVLGILRSHNLTNVLMVVVRYFGGTKLGVPGLIHAYRTAAEDAVSKAEIVVETVKIPMILKFDYTKLNDVMRILKDESIEPTDSVFEMQCQMKCAVRQSVFERLHGRLLKVCAVEIA